MKALIIFLLSMGLFARAFPQLKDYYKQVDQIVWVVKDLNAVKTGWQKIGFREFYTGDAMTTPAQEYKGKTTDIRLLPGYMNMGGIRVTWIQPLTEKNAYSDYLKKYGDGAMVLMHRVPSVEELEAETARMGSLGVKVLQKGTFTQRDTKTSYVFFDTKDKGKYVIGIYTNPAAKPRFENTSNSMNLTFNQFAFAIKGPEKVSAFWEKLGFPKMEVTHTDVWDKEYYGKSADFDMNLGWQRHGKIVYEWCIPTKPPTVYADFIKNHGEGIQHFGMATADIDESIRQFQALGFTVSQSGGWGEKGKPGSGRFAYINLESIGGETIELLWSQPD
jgi:catechol 2,3-dioxygenase-like lactoylglutathione lyase family enzyme